MSRDVFLSIGRTANSKQREFIDAVKSLLEENRLRPRTVGRTDFVTGKPLRKILSVMKQCSGTIVIAFERFHFDRGIELTEGSAKSNLSDVRLPTVWNQVEAGMAYTLGQPLLAIAESHLRSEALLEEGYDWFTKWVDLTPGSLRAHEFQTTFQKWLEKVRRYEP